MQSTEQDVHYFIDHTTSTWGNSHELTGEMLQIKDDNRLVTIVHQVKYMIWGDGHWDVTTERRY